MTLRFLFVQKSQRKSGSDQKSHIVNFTKSFCVFFERITKDDTKLLERKITIFSYLIKHIFGLEFMIFCWDLKVNMVISP